MSQFSVVFKNKSKVPLALPGNVVVKPIGKMSFSDLGGPDEAELEVSGSIEGVAQMFNLIGYGIEIRNEYASPVWWGFFNSIEVAINSLSFGATLDTMYNKIKVKYSTRNSNGTFAGVSTNWSSDAESIGRFWTKELIHSIGESHSAGATAAVALLLAQHKAPQKVIRKKVGTNAEVKARITCKGWIHALKWRYCQISRGLDQYNTRQEKSFPIGYSVTGTNISFDASSKQIRQTGTNFDLLQNGDVIKVTGSASNNNVFTVESTGDGRITVAETIVTEAAGASVTVACAYTMVSQLFQTTSTYEVDKIAINIQKVGTPSSSIALDIMTNSSGFPSGTTVQSASLTAANVGTTMTQHEFVYAGTTLTVGTTYHLRVRSNASVSAVNFYRVGYDKSTLGAPFGNGAVYNGSWAAGPFTIQLPYLITDKLDTITQIVTIASEFGQVFTDTHYTQLSSVKTTQWREGTTSAYTEVQKLVDIGTSLNYSIYIWVTPNLNFKVEVNSSATNPYGYGIDSTGRIRTSGGGYLENGTMIVGVPIRILEIPRVVLTQLDTDFVVFERCEYDFATGRLDFVIKNSRNPYRVQSITQG